MGSASSVGGSTWASFGRPRPSAAGRVLETIASASPGIPAGSEGRVGESWFLRPMTEAATLTERRRAPSPRPARAITRARRGAREAPEQLPPGIQHALRHHRRAVQPSARARPVTRGSPAGNGCLFSGVEPRRCRSYGAQRPRRPRRRDLVVAERRREHRHSQASASSTARPKPSWSEGTTRRLRR